MLAALISPAKLEFCQVQAQVLALDNVMDIFTPETIEFLAVVIHEKVLYAFCSG